MKIYKILIVIIFFTTLSYADIKKEFPSYQYVFTEFEIDESFINNKEFIRFVEKNKMEYRNRYLTALKRGGLIMPTIKAMLNQKNISPLFMYISIIESEFSPNATSRIGAGGLWQLTKNSGYILMQILMNDMTLSRQLIQPLSTLFK